MSRFKYVLLAFAVLLMLFSFYEVEMTLRSQIDVLDNNVRLLKIEKAAMQDKIEEYKLLLAEKDNQVSNMANELEKIKKEIGEPLISHVSRGGAVDRRHMKVTAYSLSYGDCGKYPDHPAYGITASGNKVKEWYTVAMGRGIPMGTKIYIPYFKDEPNKGIFIKEDTGDPKYVHDNSVDVYMVDTKDSDAFGKQYLDVYILEWGDK